MITSIEGIILKKVLFKERDLLVDFLLRNGEKIKVVFYGGAGGGTKKKSSLIELGYALKVELTNRSPKEGLFVAKEWSVKWSHQNIRNDHQSFYLLCLFLEIVNFSSQSQNEIYEEFEEKLFSVLSNALYYLDSNTKSKSIMKNTQFVVFAGKLMQVLGISPHLSRCMTCGMELDQKNIKLNLSFEKGGFNCSHCEFEGSDYGLHQKLCEIKEAKYGDINFKEELLQHNAQKIFSYLCYQFQFEPSQIKSYSMLF